MRDTASEALAAAALRRIARDESIKAYVQRDALAHGVLLNAWCEFLDHHPSKLAKANQGRPSCSLSQIQKLCSATLAARRTRTPLIS